MTTFLLACGVASVCLLADLVALWIVDREDR